MSKRQPSLKTPLIIKPLILQFLTILVSCIALIIIVARQADDGMYAHEGLSKVAAQAVVRDADGALAIRITPELAKFRQESPGLWFVARAGDGRTVSFGSVPADYAPVVAMMGKLSSADLRSSDPPYALSALIRREQSPLGELTILQHGRVDRFLFLFTAASNIVAIPIFLLLVLVSVIATPWIVNRALAGVRRTVQEAEAIDVERHGVRLSEDKVPREIAPLVSAVNDALGRLDEGYSRQRRFIASAAHELRTPVAILRMKIDASGDPAVRALSGDVSRLANLSEQLLDLQRLEHGAPVERIDLAILARQVVADLAPILVGAGKSIEVEMEHAAPIRGNSGAIERVLVNLIQNAVEHGGEQVVLRVEGTAFEVEDNGGGIPPEERGRVFEPFHRLRPRASGTGLGLNLVQQVVEHHRGRIAILDAPAGGVIVRVEFSAGG